MDAIDEAQATAEAPAAEAQAEPAAEAPPEPKVEAPGREPQIRFAEDVLATSSGETKKRKRSKKTDRKSDEPEAKAKKGRRSRRPIVQEEDEFEDIDV
jgi:hypothetical protein